MRKISKAGLSLIKNFEGCRLAAYKPVPTETYWTIGWGHYGQDVKAGMTITQARADAMLVEDLAKYEAYVNNPSYVPVIAQLNQNQFDALVSFCYNCGAGNLRSLCKGRTVVQIAASIGKYDKAGGRVLAGLTRRRAAELALYNKPDATKGEGEKMEKANVILYGKPITDVKLINGTTYVALRDVGMALGATVSWDGKTNTATLKK
ncbi:glycoside hydrolase family protein [Paenibacillus farraposensis]|uniref:Lysozyme n=1 Tax=Paenibacillus farraposensis TaxID=2807095 RepID=A0ABW4DCT6_9BACL|nr:glycoside hydrolase family protein [Paenibacillus farraposensis]MCC3379886.1 glycoside hydrolase family protein [Paenibacillus farraposensis]